MLPELRIEVEQIGDTRYRSRITDLTNGKVVARNDFDYDLALLAHIEPKGQLARGTQGNDLEAVRADVAVGAPPGAITDPIAVFGQRLFGYLVGDRAVWKTYVDNQPAFELGPARLNIALEPEAAELWSVPWEYLHDGDEFLALQGRWQIGRIPWALGEVQPSETPMPLRILVVIASPSDQHELDVEKEIEIIQDALDEAQGRGVVRVDFLEFATFDDLRHALDAERYDVLHFTGHGTWDGDNERSSLAFEDDEGRADMVTPERLCPLLAGKGLRLAVLSSCQGALTGHRDAFIGMGTAILKRANVPAVLAMQESILDASAIEMARAFYTTLGHGKTIEEALQQARLALRSRPGGPGTDWGLPALYLRAHELSLIDPEARVETKQPLWRDLGGLPLPRGFVGRKPELRAIRRAVLKPEGRRPFIYVWGLGGVGKTALAAKAVAKLDPHIDGYAVIDCRRERMPLADVLSALASFLRGRGTMETRLAETLLDSRLSLAERVDLVAQNLTRGRYLFVLDNLETQMAPAEAEAEDRRPRAFADPEWAEFFAAVFRQNWHPTWLFTSRHRLDLLDSAAPGHLLEQHLTGLNLRQAIMFMGNLPRLAREPLPDKLAAWHRVGGHPKTIELLEGWLAAAPAPAPGGPSRLRALLDDPATAGRLAQEWETYFLGALLARLTDDERRALEAVSVFEEQFWWPMVAWMTQPTVASVRRTELGPHQQAATRLLSRWHDLSLVQLERLRDDGDAQYALHPVVREYVWGQVAEGDHERLHLRAAAWFREQILGPYREQLSGKLTQENGDQVGAGVLRQLARQTQDMARARWAVATGLSWRRHLFAARRWEEAGHVVTAVYDILARWGQRDLAKSLLRESIETREGFGKAVAQGNLASLLAEEGRLDEALVTYEEVYRTFEALEAEQQMAAALSQMSSVYMNKGDIPQAIETQQASLAIDREIGNEEGQAISLHQLSMLYHMSRQFELSLETSREAGALFRKLGIEAPVAATLHQRGLCLNSMGKPAEAFKRFQASLEIKRRIGNQSGAADSLGEIGKLLMAAGQIQAAISAFNEYLEVQRCLNNPAKMGIALEWLGGVHERQGEYAAALEKYEQALTIFRRSGPPPQGIGIIERDIARVRAKMGGASQ